MYSIYILSTIQNIQQSNMLKPQNAYGITYPAGFSSHLVASNEAFGEMSPPKS